MPNGAPRARMLPLSDNPPRLPYRPQRGHRNPAATTIATDSRHSDGREQRPAAPWRCTAGHLRTTRRINDCRHLQFRLRRPGARKHIDVLVGHAHLRTLGMTTTIMISSRANGRADRQRRSRVGPASAAASRGRRRTRAQDGVSAHRRRPRISGGLPASVSAPATGSFPVTDGPDLDRQSRGHDQRRRRFGDQHAVGDLVQCRWR
jgi:hypothetical protein